MYTAPALPSSRAVDLFFRDVTHRNTFKVPTRQPVIFVCAPHSNQLIDPLIVMRTCPRPAGFLCAAKTLRQRLVGSIARALDSIPVERPQDLRRTGAGRCRREGALVEGKGTALSSELKKSDRLVVAGEECVVLEVQDDTHATVKDAPGRGSRPPSRNSESGAPTSSESEGATPAEDGFGGYSIVPHVDSASLYEAVFERLSASEVGGYTPNRAASGRTKPRCAPNRVTCVTCVTCVTGTTNRAASRRRTRTAPPSASGPLEHLLVEPS